MNSPYVMSLKESRHMVSTWRFYNFGIAKAPYVTKGVMGSLVALVHTTVYIIIFKAALEAYYPTWYPWLSCSNWATQSTNTPKSSTAREPTMDAMMLDIIGAC
jgi:hypothetical protein